MTDDRWDDLGRLAREALDAAEAPCSTCGSDIGPGADAYIAAAHPQAILDLVGEVRVVTESRERGCACGDDDVCSFVAERDALRAEVERLRERVEPVCSEPGCEKLTRPTRHYSFCWEHTF